MPICQICQKNFELITGKHLNKHGVTTELYRKIFPGYPLGYDDIQQRKYETCIKNYGVKYNSQVPEIVNKRKETCLDRYGKDSYFKTEEFKQKNKKLCMEKYGVDNPTKSKKVQEKRKKTCLEKYGVDHPLKLQKYLAIQKETNLNRYGSEFVSQNEKIKEKMRITLQSKYQVKNASQILQVKIKKRKTWMKKHSLFCMVEDIKINEKTGNLLVHCKNHNCPNSKEQGGFFEASSNQLHSRIAHIEKDDGNGGSYFYCSKECKISCQLYYFNLYREEQKEKSCKNVEFPYTQGEYQTFREYVLTRDNYKCQYCNEKAEHVHHERPQKLEPFFSLDPDYAWSVCKKCHYEKGHKDECSTGNLATITCK